MTKHLSRFAQLALVLCALVLSACATPSEKADTLASDAGWKWENLSTERFVLASARTRDRHGDTLWVYIEGDGFAYIDPDTPSSDPTPHDPVALRLALVQPGKAPVAYLARPCQYPSSTRECPSAYWTSARYAPEVINSTNLAINYLKDKMGASHVILVGYSGGGAVAVLAASHRTDVIGLITVVADLDTAYWTKRDGLSPLAGSMNPVSVAESVAYIPQVHFTGAQDDNVGTDVVRSFVKHLPPGSPVRVTEIPDFGHSCCWASKWPELIAPLSLPPAATLAAPQ